MATSSSQFPPTFPASRPLGVSILAVLVGLYAILIILGAVFALVGAAAVAYLGSGLGFTGLPLVVVGGVLLILGIIVLAAALGLWHLRLWALVLALIVTFIELVTHGLSGSWVGFALALIIFVYLIAVRRHFR